MESTDPLHELSQLSDHELLALSVSNDSAQASALRASTRGRRPYTNKMRNFFLNRRDLLDSARKLRKLDGHTD